jgi:hypothetical protein
MTALIFLALFNFTVGYITGWIGSTQNRKAKEREAKRQQYSADRALWNQGDKNV